ncbi:MAG: hypothetical protein A2504_03130 [Bdellovibrionales bacterium RIFOXYD12_FULL_39_22]|nr:MAG: hypothetical protein A2385_15540 [Bdellovibrionales bacterium RIFOXYB1_FULL_39_21]OFZ41523.1 MAG: hypothetical protein A2485_02230 [Bdellovibrionales bacterium RIFOXYC12_FULL_39_17]OFZ45836.1 MAG: hypothetical protein A2404_12595 [Bdellovibrionales bacterium RIFOXYC1_FULL_39_130]OFZ74767.1 MAG: hypothetical protein A2560_10025 [Bdellovibrionales bacterium RIFOXYD1_FULL_39_84]OFZ77294.1 MAG: hypothetical protein A2451_02280 [Bdellovibrionales bacterium RIFOXYC2_FULL_39_8]OFZ92628.1 MAG:
MLHCGFTKEVFLVVALQKLYTNKSLEEREIWDLKQRGEKFMSKRNKVVKTTPESDALKRIREKSELSLRKLADKMEISFARAHQMESGREDVTSDYISKFLKALNLTLADWNYHLEKSRGRPSCSDLRIRDECVEIIYMLEPSKLEMVYAMLNIL